MEGLARGNTVMQGVLRGGILLSYTTDIFFSNIILSCEKNINDISI